MIKCPKCKVSDGVREIVYGFAILPLDESKFALGGCVIANDNPTHTCKKCGFEWSKQKQKNKVDEEVSSRDRERIAVDVALGIPKEKLRVKIDTPELEEIYDVIKKETDEAREKGYVIEFPNLGTDFEPVKKMYD